MTIRGYDLSIAQGTLTSAHWQALAATPDLRFVSLRAGNGNEAPDPSFAGNWIQARNADLVVQAYAPLFPLRPDGNHADRAPEAQAEEHFRVARGVGMGPRELAPAVDLEWPPPEQWTAHNIDAAFIVGSAATYGRRMTVLTGRRPYLYVYPYYWRELVAQLPHADLVDELAAIYDLWAAEYGVPGPYLLAPWTSIDFWQRSGGGGHLPNGAHVDEDVFEGDEAAFRVAANLPALPPRPVV
jgi:GH25 family lysozyme M1 (1,4-beta-N-acetylmuramidase)